MSGRLFAYKIVKEPPQAWEVEVREPELWRGVFRSQDGIAWWSPVLDRPLGEHHNNPGETEMLRRLQAIARAHEVSNLQAVAAAARELILTLRDSGSLSEVGAARDRLESALRHLEGANPRESDEAALVVARPGVYALEPFRPVSPQYIGDGHPALRAAGYEPEPEGAEEL